jgi:hypothetical protein
MLVVDEFRQVTILFLSSAMTPLKSARGEAETERRCCRAKSSRCCDCRVVQPGILWRAIP